jgi:hypothetical protein
MKRHKSSLSLSLYLCLFPSLSLISLSWGHSTKLTFFRSESNSSPELTCWNCDLEPLDSNTMTKWLSVVSHLVYSIVVWQLQIIKTSLELDNSWTLHTHTQIYKHMYVQTYLLIYIPVSINQSIYLSTHLAPSIYLWIYLITCMNIEKL